LLGAPVKANRPAGKVLSIFDTTQSIASGITESPWPPPRSR
jgi:hypothetical protein